MTRSGERDLSRIGGLDYALMTCGSCLAAMSGSLSVQFPAVGVFAVIAILLGGSVSYAVRVALLRSKYVRLDGVLYTVAMVAALTFGANLQALMPDGGYPVDIMAAGWLTWMLILGSFFTWQDATLLFQAVPSIALFGLAGIYSTWGGVTYAFFGFMVCLAMLVARAHRRAMLVQAAQSGYFTRGLAPGTPTPSVETTPGLARRMQEGPWKWIAGPEWALLSALAIVLVSVLGAPVIKLAIQPVSGFAKLSLPRSVTSRLRASAATGLDPSNSVPVGMGPNQLSPTPVFEIRSDRQNMPSLQYLRTEAYYGFSSSHRWEVMRPPLTPRDADPGAATVQSILAIESQQELSFDIRLRRTLRYLPTPGFVSGWDGYPPLQSQFDGRIVAQGPLVDQVLTGHSVVASPGIPTTAEKDVPSIFRDAVQATVTPRVAQLVQKTIQGAKTDFDKAQLIRNKISATIKYNINASAVPTGADPVEYTLFDHPEAYCDVYATAMTQMARAAGIPARFVYGYRPSFDHVDRNGWTVVLESDLHAWSELYFQDYGWVVFDATDGADSVPGAGIGSSNVGSSIWSNPWVQQSIDILIGACLIYGVFVGGRFWYVSQRDRTPRTDLDRAYIRFTSLLERAGRVRRAIGATPDEFLTGAAPHLGSAYPEAEELNAHFVRLMYSPQPTTPEDVAGIRARIRQLAKAIKRAG